MDKQKKTITELTPDQMDKVSGGVNDEHRIFRCEACGYEFVTDDRKLPCPRCGTPNPIPVYI